MNEFVKGHGLGNDYIVFRKANINFPLTPEAIRLICRRHFGVGADGVLLLVDSETADFGLRIFNPDGSEAEKSGNGIRIFAKFLYDHGYTTKRDLTIETAGGLVRAQLEVRGGRAAGLTIDMGRATFWSPAIPVDGAEREVIRQPLEIEGEYLEFTAVSVGNPHCVILTDDLDPERVRRLGPRIEHHPLFPERINVQFATVCARDQVKILIWERGAGYTLASGSSACAVAAVCRKLGVVEPRVTLQMPGGELTIDVDAEWNLRMQGPATEVYTGQLSEELVQQILTAPAS
ncbi:MAG: diaminopimelate epimerase [Candidatus Methylomirabilales bacterium]